MNEWEESEVRVRINREIALLIDLVYSEPGFGGIDHWWLIGWLKELETKPMSDVLQIIRKASSTSDKQKQFIDHWIMVLGKNPESLPDSEKYRLKHY